MTMTLQEISDRMEIQDLLVKYSYAIDTRDFEALDGVFTADAWIDYTVFGGMAGTLPEIQKYLTETMPMFQSFQHMVSTSQITLDGDTAQVKTICHNPMVMPLGHDKVQVFYCGLWYVDEMVRTAEGWRITKRVEEKSYVHNMPGIGDS